MFKLSSVITSTGWIL